VRQTALHIVRGELLINMVLLPDPIDIPWFMAPVYCGTKIWRLNPLIVHCKTDLNRLT